mmetsp:Transcript_14761/g.41851  ORF Transcript_14761/g.41851 Transcript_14761/m.41851 type:complete len:215 (-) Transcript_14761:175-819(-)
MSLDEVREPFDVFSASIRADCLRHLVRRDPDTEESLHPRKGVWRALDPNAQGADGRSIHAEFGVELSDVQRHGWAAQIWLDGLEQLECLLLVLEFRVASCDAKCQLCLKVGECSASSVLVLCLADGRMAVAPRLRALRCRDRAAKPPSSVPASSAAGAATGGAAPFACSALHCTSAARGYAPLLADSFLVVGHCPTSFPFGPENVCEDDQRLEV